MSSHRSAVRYKTVSSKIKREAIEDESTRLLMTIPEIGYYGGLLILSQVGDVNRFPDSHHLCSYAGLTPSTHSSGGVTYRRIDNKDRKQVPQMDTDRMRGR